MNIKKANLGKKFPKRTKKQALTYVQILLILLVSAIIVVVTMPVLFKSYDFYKTRADMDSQYYQEEKENVVEDYGFVFKDNDVAHFTVELLDSAGQPLNPPVTYQTGPLEQGGQMVIVVKRKNL